MKVTKTFIEGLLIVEPAVFPDKRGYFFESYNKEKYIKNGIEENFVQDNVSFSQKDVLRGLHFQNPPFAQAKLVSVLRGSVLDVAVDIRKDSATYGKYVSIVLSEENKRQFFIPVGFAHGFLTLEDNTLFSYKCSNVYNKESEGSILWKDDDIGIDWGVENPIISPKDHESPLFNELHSQF